MSMPMLAGVGLLVVCCSSSSAMMMMMGGEEDPGGGGGGGGGGGAVEKTHSTPLEGKIYHTDTRVGWVDPGPKSVEGHIGGTSIKDCYDKAPDGAVIAGWRSGTYADVDYQNTCFYYNSSQAGAPVQVIGDHHIACMDSTKDVNTGCGIPRTSELLYHPLTTETGWIDPGPKPGGHISTSLEGCVSQAPSEAVIVGFRDGAYPDPGYDGTCFYYSKTQSGPPQGSKHVNHHLTCKDPSKTVASGCA